MLNLTKGQDSKVFKLLADLHVHACGMKAFGSYAIEKYGEFLKQACGGHGYLQISGLTRMHVNFGFGIVTAEGDNTVLL